MTPRPTLYRVRPGSKRDQLIVKDVWSQKGGEPLAVGYRHIVPLAVAGQTYLLAFDAKGNGSAFRVTGGAPWLAPAPAKISLGRPFDIVEPFVLGMVPYLLAYESATGQFSFVPIADDLSSRPPYEFYHSRPPVTTAFTVAKPIVVNGLLYFLGYGETTGEVNLYSLQVTDAPQPGTGPGTPPLVARHVLGGRWAESWTHFAFFTLGRENFFFKINVGKLNVNIDHVLDDPSHGTVEVGTHLEHQLEAPLKIDIVRAFDLSGGDPYFLTYVKSGRTAWFRFHSDCQGWTRCAADPTVKNATHIVPFSVGHERFALFC